jgi:hypothetical protein
MRISLDSNDRYQRIEDSTNISIRTRTLLRHLANVQRMRISLDSNDRYQRIEDSTNISIRYQRFQCK